MLKICEMMDLTHREQREKDATSQNSKNAMSGDFNWAGSPPYIVLLYHGAKPTEKRHK